MSEVADLVMPVLQSIQARFGSIERVLSDHTHILADNGQKLDDIEIHLGYLTGIESDNKFDLSKLRERLKSVEDKLKSTEPQT